MLREIPTLHTFPPRSQPHSDEDQVGFETKAVSEGSRHQSGCDHREHSLIACKMKGFLSLQELVLLFMVKSTKSGQFVFFKHTKGTSRQPLLISKLVSTRISSHTKFVLWYGCCGLSQVMTRSACKEKAWDGLLR